MNIIFAAGNYKFSSKKTLKTFLRLVINDVEMNALLSLLETKDNINLGPMYFFRGEVPEQYSSFPKLTVPNSKKELEEFFYNDYYRIFHLPRVTLIKVYFKALKKNYIDNSETSNSNYYIKNTLTDEGFIFNNLDTLIYFLHLHTKLGLQALVHESLNAIQDLDFGISTNISGFEITPFSYIKKDQDVTLVNPEYFDKVKKDIQNQFRKVENIIYKLNQ